MLLFGGCSGPSTEPAPPFQRLPLDAKMWTDPRMPNVEWGASELKTPRGEPAEGHIVLMLGEHLVQQARPEIPGSEAL